MAAAKNFSDFKISLGLALLLGLEILVLGDVIETITVPPTFASPGVLACLVVVRTVVSWTLTRALEIAGAGALVLATVRWVRQSLQQGARSALAPYRQGLGRTVLIGLEVLVALLAHWAHSGVRITRYQMLCRIAVHPRPRLFRLSAALTASLPLVGCDEECAEGVCVPVNGYYYDSLVTGVAYEARNEEGPTRTGTTGEDDDPGRFKYLNEETVGGCQVDGTLPEDDFRIVHNLAVLLQTMDTDGEHTTGIEISSDVAALFEGVSIDVDQAWAAFQTDPDLLGVLEAANNQSLFPDARELRTREEALRALYEGIGLCTPES